MNADTVRAALHDFITRDLMRDPSYTIEPDEGIITGGLIDSFSLAQIGVFVEEKFGIYIPDPDLTVTKMNTLDAMVARVVRDVK